MRPRRHAPAGAAVTLTDWLERLWRRGPASPRRSTGVRPPNPMTMSERDAADEAWKQAMRQYDDEESAPSPPEQLTPAELRALALTAEGMMVKEIAAHYGVSHETIKRQLSKARTRLGARTTVHAVVLAYRDGQLHL